MSSSNERACINCEKVFDTFKIALHEPGCIRSYTKCKECNELIEKDEFENHIEGHKNPNSIKPKIIENTQINNEKNIETSEIYKRGISSICDNVKPKLCILFLSI